VPELSGFTGNVADFRDPKDIYRESLANIPLRSEDTPPTIQRAEVWPYPELNRLWLRVQTGPFAAGPNLAFTWFDPDGQPIASMDIIAISSPYASLTMHLRRPPRPGEAYLLRIELSRDEGVLDRREVAFALVFREPEQ
jgi:hypothetical protein